MLEREHGFSGLLAKQQSPAGLQGDQAQPAVKSPEGPDAGTGAAEGGGDGAEAGLDSSNSSSVSSLSAMSPRQAPPTSPRPARPTSPACNRKHPGTWTVSALFLEYKSALSCPELFYLETSLSRLSFQDRICIYHIALNYLHYPEICYLEDISKVPKVMDKWGLAAFEVP